MPNSRDKRGRLEAARRGRRRRQRIRWGAAVVVAVVTAVAITSLWGPSRSEEPAAAPDFELSTPDGQTVRLSDYLGQPVAVTFMHTY